MLPTTLAKYCGPGGGLVCILLYTNTCHCGSALGQRALFLLLFPLLLHVCGHLKVNLWDLFNFKEVWHRHVLH